MSYRDSLYGIANALDAGSATIETAFAQFLRYTASEQSEAVKSADPAKVTVPTDDQYYLQDTRGTVGNDVLFWAKGAGYTTDVSKAEVFTKLAAKLQHRCRETDLPWPKAYIDQHARPAVDFQYINHDKAMLTAAAKERDDKGE